MNKIILKYLFSGLIVPILFVFIFVSCGGGDKKNNNIKTDTLAKKSGGDIEFAEKIVAEFMKKDADYLTLTKNLMPNLNDCKSYLINEEDAQKLFEHLTKFFDKKIKENKPIKPDSNQDDYLIYSANTDLLKAKEWKDEVDSFPPAYHKFAKKMNPDINIYLFKFVKQGKFKGVCYDGLTFINNHWVIFPKPWQAFKEKAIEKTKEKTKNKETLKIKEKPKTKTKKKKNKKN